MDRGLRQVIIEVVKANLASFFIREKASRRLVR